MYCSQLWRNPCQSISSHCLVLTLRACVALLVRTPLGCRHAGELKPPRVLRAERTALERQLIADIVDGERFGAQVARLCDAFGTAQKKMIAGADQDHHHLAEEALLLHPSPAAEDVDANATCPDSARKNGLLIFISVLPPGISLRRESSATLVPKQHHEP